MSTTEKLERLNALRAILTMDKQEVKYSEVLEEIYSIYKDTIYGSNSIYSTIKNAIDSKKPLYSSVDCLILESILTTIYPLDINGTNININNYGGRIDTNFDKYAFACVKPIDNNGKTNTKDAVTPYSKKLKELLLKINATNYSYTLEDELGAIVSYFGVLKAIDVITYYIHATN